MGVLPVSVMPKLRPYDATNNQTNRYNLGGIYPNGTVYPNQESTNFVDNVAFAIPLGAGLSTLSLLTFLGNAMVVHAIRTERKLHTVSNMFILSLAIADLIVGLIVMPISSIYVLFADWILGIFVCQLWLVIDYTASTASIFNLLILSLDRYWSIRSPLKYLCKRTKKRALVMIAIVWMISALWAIPIIGWHIWYNTGIRKHPNNVCETEFSDSVAFKVTTSIANFIVPMSLIVIIYYKIFCEIKRRGNFSDINRSVSRVSCAHHRKQQQQIALAQTSSISTDGNSHSSRHSHSHQPAQQHHSCPNSHYATNNGIIKNNKNKCAKQTNTTTETTMLPINNNSSSKNSQKNHNSNWNGIVPTNENSDKPFHRHQQHYVQSNYFSRKYSNEDSDSKPNFILRFFRLYFGGNQFSNGGNRDSSTTTTIITKKQSSTSLAAINTNYLNSNSLKRQQVVLPSINYSNSIKKSVSSGSMTVSSAVISVRSAPVPSTAETAATIASVEIGNVVNSEPISPILRDIRLEHLSCDNGHRIVRNKLNQIQLVNNNRNSCQNIIDCIGSSGGSGGGNGGCNNGNVNNYFHPVTSAKSASLIKTVTSVPNYHHNYCSQSPLPENDRQQISHPVSTTTTKHPQCPAVVDSIIPTSSSSYSTFKSNLLLSSTSSLSLSESITSLSSESEYVSEMPNFISGNAVRSTKTIISASVCTNSSTSETTTSSSNCLPTQCQPTDSNLIQSIVSNSTNHQSVPELFSSDFIRKNFSGQSNCPSALQANSTSRSLKQLSMSEPPSKAPYHNSSINSTNLVNKVNSDGKQSDCAALSLSADNEKESNKLCSVIKSSSSCCCFCQELTLSSSSSSTFPKSSTVNNLVYKDRPSCCSQLTKQSERSTGTLVSNITTTTTKSSAVNCVDNLGANDNDLKINYNNSKNFANQQNTKCNILQLNSMESNQNQNIQNIQNPKQQYQHHQQLVAYYNELTLMSFQTKLLSAGVNSANNSSSPVNLLASGKQSTNALLLEQQEQKEFDPIGTILLFDLSNNNDNNKNNNNSNLNLNPMDINNSEDNQTSKLTCSQLSTNDLLTNCIDNNIPIIDTNTGSKDANDDKCKQKTEIDLISNISTKTTLQQSSSIITGYMLEENHYPNVNVQVEYISNSNNNNKKYERSNCNQHSKTTTRINRNNNNNQNQNKHKVNNRQQLYSRSSTNITDCDVTNHHHHHHHPHHHNHSHCVPKTKSDHLLNRSTLSKSPLLLNNLESIEPQPNYHNQQQRQSNHRSSSSSSGSLFHHLRKSTRTTRSNSLAIESSKILHKINQKENCSKENNDKSHYPNKNIMRTKPTICSHSHNNDNNDIATSAPVNNNKKNKNLRTNKSNNEWPLSSSYSSPSSSSSSGSFSMKSPSAPSIYDFTKPKTKLNKKTVKEAIISPITTTINTTTTASSAILCEQKQLTTTTTQSMLKCDNGGEPNSVAGFVDEIQKPESKMMDEELKLKLNQTKEEEKEKSKPNNNTNRKNRNNKEKKQINQNSLCDEMRNYYCCSSTSSNVPESRNCSGSGGGLANADRRQHNKNKKCNKTLSTKSKSSSTTDRIGKSEHLLYCDISNNNNNGNKNDAIIESDSGAIITTNNEQINNNFTESCSKKFEIRKKHSKDNKTRNNSTKIKQSKTSPTPSAVSIVQNQKQNDEDEEDEYSESLIKCRSPAMRLSQCSMCGISIHSQGNESISNETESNIIINNDSLISKVIKNGFKRMSDLRNVDKKIKKKKKSHPQELPPMPPSPSPPQTAPQLASSASSKQAFNLLSQPTSLNSRSSSFRESIRFKSFHFARNRNDSIAMPANEFCDECRCVASAVSAAARHRNALRREESSRLRQEKKAARQLGVILGAFILCWMPYIITYIVTAYCTYCISLTAHQMTIWLGYLNSFLNPFLYALCNENFKHAFKKMLGRATPPKHFSNNFDQTLGTTGGGASVSKGQASFR